MTWKTARREIKMGPRPLVMGILNLTPDSFSDLNRLTTPDLAKARAWQLVEEGADLLDLGAESTRPGATPVALETEWTRLEPVLQALSGGISIPISIDTYKPEIARRARDYGVEIINDVSGGQWQNGMWDLVARLGYGYILTHSQGQPPTMQDNPHYGDVLAEITSFLDEKITACQALGMARSQIVIDPGVGFGKTSDHNWAILAGLKRFQTLDRPLLIGVSRKSFLKKIAGEDSLAVSTLTAQVWASTQGARIWRVHEVAAAVAAARIVEQLQKNESRTS